METLNIDGPTPSLPNDKTVLDIFRDVFDELYNNTDAISDLSLPPQSALCNDFARTISRIKISFIEHEDTVDCPVSTTTQYRGGDFVSHVKVHFNQRERQECPEVIEARLLHEATHGLRYAMIRMCDSSNVSPEKMMMTTPEKKKEDRLFPAARDGTHYKLEQNGFHSGYWMEHRKLGGVWVILYGDVLNACDDIQSLPPYGMPFKVVRKTGNSRTVKSIDEESYYQKFDELEGYDQDGNHRLIFHCGERMTRTDEDEGCGRVLA